MDRQSAPTTRPRPRTTLGQERRRAAVDDGDDGELLVGEEKGVLMGCAFSERPIKDAQERARLR